MKDLTDEEEEALGLAFAHRDDGLQTYTGKAARAFAHLAEAGMVDVDLDLSGNVTVKSVRRDGMEHMKLVRESLLAAGVEPLSTDADRVLRDLAWEETCAGADGDSVRTHKRTEKDKIYFELSRKGMLPVTKADNIAYAIYSLTDTGWKYVRAMVPAKEDKVEVSNNQQVTTVVNASASASASATATISDAYRAIRDSNATDEQKRMAEDGIAEMEHAVAKHDLAAFAAGMEKAASVDKSVGTIATAVVPLVARLIGGM